MSQFKLIIRSVPGLQQCLLKELNGLGLNKDKIKAEEKLGENYFSFRADSEEILKIMSQSRTYEELKIQIGNDFLARGEQELNRNLNKLPFHAFLSSPQQLQDNVQQLLVYFPQMLNNISNSKINNNQIKNKLILAKSFGSNLYMESKIESILQKHINLIEVRKFYKSQKKIYSGIEQDIKRIQQNNNEQKEIQLIINQNNNINIVRSDQLEIMKENKIVKQIKQPKLSINIINNKAQVLMSLSNHKQGFKDYQGWGQIKENIVSSLINEIIQNKENKKEFKYWDPFCGSGTIISQLICKLMEVKKEMSLDQFQNLLQIPTLAKDETLKQIGQYYKRQEKDTDKVIELVGSDISGKQIENSYLNINSLIQNNNELLDNNKVIGRNIQHIIKQDIPFMEKVTLMHNLLLIKGDFESIFKQLNLKGFSIISNLPYGIQSSQTKDLKEVNQLEQLYKRFSEFIKKNIEDLDEVYLIYPLQLKPFMPNLIKNELLVWDTQFEFSNGGINMALFRLNKQATKEIKIISIQEKKEQNLLQKYQNETSKAIYLKEQQKIKSENREKDKKQYMKLYNRARKIIRPIQLKKMDIKLKRRKNKMKSFLRNKQLDYVKRQKLIQMKEIIKSQKTNEITQKKQRFSNKQKQYIKNVLKEYGKDDKETIEKINQSIENKIKNQTEKEVGNLVKEVKKRKIIKW